MNSKLSKERIITASFNLLVKSSVHLKLSMRNVADELKMQAPATY